MFKDDPNQGYALVSGYAKGDRFLTLRADGHGGFFYTGNRKSGSFGKDVGRDEALERFKHELGHEPVKLDHVAGERLDDPFEALTIGEPLTKAEFKRHMSVGSQWTLARFVNGVEQEGAAPRTVQVQQSADIACRRNHGSADVARSELTWLGIPRPDKMRLLEDGGIMLFNEKAQPFMLYRPVS